MLSGSCHLHSVLQNSIPRSQHITAYTWKCFGSLSIQDTIRVPEYYITLSAPDTLKLCSRLVPITRPQPDLPQTRILPTNVGRKTAGPQEFIMPTHHPGHSHPFQTCSRRHRLVVPKQHLQYDPAVRSSHVACETCSYENTISGSFIEPLIRACCNELCSIRSLN